MKGIGHILLVLTLATPLTLALLAPLLSRPIRLLPWAAVPGLIAALFVPRETLVELPVFLLGLSLALDRIGAVFLGFGSLLWLLAGAYARGYLANSEHTTSFSICWLAALAGTLGTFIAVDVVTFYLSFSVLSLAAYGLIIHDRTASARRAGRVYIGLAVFGEAALLAAFMLAATTADSLLISDVRAALTASPWGNYALAGLLVGFGIKVGLVPLHVWLPLAHPEAPTPASAVLSGVIVKAGILGLIRFLPMDGASLLGDALIILGLVTAYYGVLVGLAQSNSKAILAYSTLSQMGLVVTVLGSGIGQPDAAHTLDVATLYAIQHGLAKGALFLSVGIIAAGGARPLRPFIVVTAFTAFTIAGLPLSGGALAKLAIKGPLGQGTVSLLVTLSAVGTALLMLRFLFVLTGQRMREAVRAPISSMSVPWAGMVAAALVIPWMLFSQLSGHPLALAVSPASLWAALWPIVVAVATARVVLWLFPSSPVSASQGDLVVIGELVIRNGVSLLVEISTGLSALNSTLRRIRFVPPFDPLGFVEQRLQRWAVAGPTLLIIVICIGVAIGA